MRQFSRFRPILPLVLATPLLMSGCRKSSPTGPGGSASEIIVTTSPGGPVSIRTTAAEFQILPSGYVEADLLKNGKRLTLDRPSGSSLGAADSVTVAGKEVRNFALDFDHVTVSPARGKIGEQGKRIEITGRSYQDDGVLLEETLALEVYNDFPDLLITWSSYKNRVLSVGVRDLS